MPIGVHSFRKIHFVTNKHTDNKKNTLRSALFRTRGKQNIFLFYAKMHRETIQSDVEKKRKHSGFYQLNTSDIQLININSWYFLFSLLHQMFNDAIEHNKLVIVLQSSAFLQNNEYRGVERQSLENESIDFALVRFTMRSIFFFISLSIFNSFAPFHDLISW